MKVDKVSVHSNKMANTKVQCNKKRGGEVSRTMRGPV